MQEIRCPKCGEVFQVDESGYAEIANQVRDREFEKEMQRREKELDARREQELEVIRLQEEKEHNKAITKKEAELSEKDRLIAELKARIEAGETEKKLAVAEAVEKKNEEISEKTAEIVTLQGELKSKETENQLKENNLKEQHKQEIAFKDEEIERLKDFRAKQSTKMIGESLEQHCLTQFNSIRMTAFPNAYFEKDNDIKTGSKGDFIYREKDGDTEFISIMFEMKNEADTTATKHKNSDFFKELDKDRREKGCEYAILVSLLESDNELYNNGIVDVSYIYPKMYVIRPQFFIPIITLLRNAAQNSIKYRKELQIVQNQQLDIHNFEEEMNTFKKGFARNYEIASNKFKTAIEEIDKTIRHLEKTKEALVGSENNLRLANEKADELSIKKLTKNAPSVREMFENSEKNKD